MKKIFGVMLVVLIAMMIFALPSYAQEQQSTAVGYYFCKEVSLKMALMPDSMAYVRKIGGPVVVCQYKVYDENKVVMLDFGGQGLMFKPEGENLVFSHYDPDTDKLTKLVFIKQADVKTLAEFLE